MKNQKWLTIALGLLGALGASFLTAFVIAQLRGDGDSIGGQSAPRHPIMPATQRAAGHEPGAAIPPAVLAQLAHKAVLRGIVVDEDESPLSNVQMTVTGVHMNEGPNPRDESIQLTVNGNFDIDPRVFFRVHMMVMRPGYEMRMFAVGTDTSEGRQLTVFGEGGPLPGVRPDNLRIVLIRSRPRSVLLRTAQDAVLSCDVHWPRDVLMPAVPGEGPGHTSLSFAHFEVEHDDLVPEHCLSLAVESADGQAFAPTPAHSAVPSAPPDLILKSFKLVMSSKDDGFISCHGPASPAPDQMNEAPAEGYVPQLVPPHEFLLGRTAQMQVCYFFFKVSNKYGRGCILPPRLNDDGSRVYVPTDLRLQPDGSRNLEAWPSPKSN